MRGARELREETKAKDLRLDALRAVGSGLSIIRHASAIRSPKAMIAMSELGG